MPPLAPQRGLPLTSVTLLSLHPSLSPLTLTPHSHPSARRRRVPASLQRLCTGILDLDQGLPEEAWAAKMRKRGQKELYAASSGALLPRPSTHARPRVRPDQPWHRGLQQYSRDAHFRHGAGSLWAPHGEAVLVLALQCSKVMCIPQPPQHNFMWPVLDSESAADRGVFKRWAERLSTSRAPLRSRAPGLTGSRSVRDPSPCCTCSMRQANLLPACTSPCS
jgi:hypothetical protein